ncbi:MAG: metallophosphoesterase, partial [Rhodoferax sp.]|nr:metallophosphoesterase [Rhodoferax sp.]
MPFLPITLFSAMLHAWIGWRIVPALDSMPGWPASGGSFAFLLLLSAVLMPMSFVLGRRPDKPMLEVLAVWLGLLLMGLFSSLFVLTLLRDVFLLLAWLVVWLASLRGGELASLDRLQATSAAAVPLLALAATGWGFWNARRTASVVSVDVPIAGLPAALHGFTVAQISDIHIGATIRRAYLGRIVARVNALRADMVAITGDLVDGSVADLALHVAPLADLQSRHGTFFVTGNHEYYSGALPWIDELRRLGVQVLVNQHVVLRHPGAEAMSAGAALVLAGVADFGAHHFIESHRSDPVAALKGAPDDVPTRVLLAHQPRSAQAASQAGFQLQLSGHTHGGQIWPWNYFVRFQQPFTAGLSRLHQLWVYTNRGTGYWGPPKRFGVPSEITHLRLVTA